MAGSGLLCQPPLHSYKAESFVYLQSAKVNSRFTWRSWSLQHRVAPPLPLNVHGERKQPLLDSPPPARFPTPPSPSLRCPGWPCPPPGWLSRAPCWGLCIRPTLFHPAHSEQQRGLSEKHANNVESSSCISIPGKLPFIHHVQYQYCPLQRGLP